MKARDTDPEENVEYPGGGGVQHLIVELRPIHGEDHEDQHQKRALHVYHGLELVPEQQARRDGEPHVHHDEHDCTYV